MFFLHLHAAEIYLRIMNRSRLSLLLTLIAVLILSACGGRATPMAPTPDLSQNLRPKPTLLSIADLTSAPTQAADPVLTQPTGELPLTEADVPRVTVQDAKAALETGEAIIVDVRGADAYSASHVAGAINIQLGEFETNPLGLNLDKDQWIITYCT